MFYTLCFYTLWQLCQWGGVRSHLKRLLPLAALLFIGILIKLLLRHRVFAHRIVVPASLFSS